jgi:hypothetical protein
VLLVFAGAVGAAGVPTNVGESNLAILVNNEPLPMKSTADIVVEKSELVKLASGPSNFPVSVPPDNGSFVVSSITAHCAEFAQTVE